MSSNLLFLTSPKVNIQNSFRAKTLNFGNFIQLLWFFWGQELVFLKLRIWGPEYLNCCIRIHSKWAEFAALYNVHMLYS